MNVCHSQCLEVVRMHCAASMHTTRKAWPHELSDISDYVFACAVLGCEERTTAPWCLVCTSKQELNDVNVKFSSLG